MRYLISGKCNLSPKFHITNSPNMIHTVKNAYTFLEIKVCKLLFLWGRSQMKSNENVIFLRFNLCGTACDLHMAMSLISKLKAFGLHAPSDSIKIQPEAILERRQRRQRRCEVNFLSRFLKHEISPTTAKATSKYGIWRHRKPELIQSSVIWFCVLLP